MGPPCCVSKRHFTVAGPLVSMVPSIRSGEMTSAQVVVRTVLGPTSTVTWVTEAVGISTTGTAPRLPPVVVTLVATQHRLPELKGSTMYHQLPSEFLPAICEPCPAANELMGAQTIPGPK